MKKLSFPAAHTVLLIIAALTAALTWVVPAGQYDRLVYDKEQNSFTQTGKADAVTLPASQQTLDKLNIKIPLEKFTGGDIWKPVGIPNTYHQLEANPQGIKALIQSPLKGVMEAMDVILFVLIIGGFIGVVNHSGAFDAGMNWLASTLKGRETILIILITSLIALGGTTFGLAEETIAFYPILVPIFLLAGYDAMVALAAIYVGSSIGTMVSTVNPFSVIIASDAAGISWTTGLYGRIAMLILCTAVCLWYIIRYANRVKKDPSRSVIFDKKEEIEKLFLHNAAKDIIAFSMQIRLILLVFMSCFVIMIVGVSKLDWWFLEMTTVFFIGAIVIGIIARLGEKNFIRELVKGANDLLSVALIIGFARGVTVLMDDGLISDTLLFYASGLTEGMNKGIFVNTLMFIYAGLSFFVPSSSGMAVLTMPIMAPLADGVGLGREMVVYAYQYGMGLFAFINPTGLILASLAMVQVGFDRWIKFIMPLVGLITLLTMVVLTGLAYL
ncbi:MAG: YfcC family protein [Flavobacteriales bacterium]|nr:YfcC family protein [Flavobacteriales bacterium]